MEKRRLTFEEAEDLEKGLCPHCDVETKLIHVGRGLHCQKCDAVFKLDENDYYYELGGVN